VRTVTAAKCICCRLDDDGRETKATSQPGQSVPSRAGPRRCRQAVSTRARPHRALSGRLITALRTVRYAQRFNDNVAFCDGRSKH